MKLVCMFSGWCEKDTDDVNLMDCESGVVKTATEWIKERGNIKGLILESFDKLHSTSTDGEFVDLDLSVEDD